MNNNHPAAQASVFFAVANITMPATTAIPPAQEGHPMDLFSFLLISTGPISATFFSVVKLMFVNTSIKMPATIRMIPRIRIIKILIKELEKAGQNSENR